MRSSPASRPAGLRVRAGEHSAKGTVPAQDEAEQARRQYARRCDRHGDVSKPCRGSPVDAGCLLEARHVAFENDTIIQARNGSAMVSVRDDERRPALHESRDEEHAEQRQNHTIGGSIWLPSTPDAAHPARVEPAKA